MYGLELLVLFLCEVFGVVSEEGYPLKFLRLPALFFEESVVLREV